MSVILDALHKARGDKRNAKSEPQPHSVARVLEAGVAPAEFRGEGRERRSGGRGWIAVFAVGFGLLCLLVLIGGGFFLLYDQVRRLEHRASAGAVEAATSTVTGPGKATELVNTSPMDLPPPLPVEELPVQPPAAAVPLVAEQASVAPAQPQFKLGSIVCESGECVAGLNGRSVRVGDEIRGYQVTEITETAVSLKNMTGNDVVRLSQFD